MIHSINKILCAEFLKFFKIFTCFTTHRVY
jgi:hypothetical protein